jgi:hypothetical protein
VIIVLYCLVSTFVTMLMIVFFVRRATHHFLLVD